MTKETLKRAPQVVIPRRLHDALRGRSMESGVKVQALTAEALELGMRMKRWLPDPAEETATA